MCTQKVVYLRGYTLKVLEELGCGLFDIKSILFDYSVKFMGLSNEKIDCDKHEIVDKILDWFNGKKDKA